MKERDPTKLKKENADALNSHIVFCEENELPKKFLSKSGPTYNLYEIIKCYRDIYFINLEYVPTQEEADKATEIKRISEESLRIIQEELNRIRKDKEDSINESNNLLLRIEELKKDLNICKTRLQNAQDLILNLKNEKINWEKKKDQLIKDERNVIGDIFISSGIVAYLGPFTKSFRIDIINKWVSLIDSHSIPINLNNDIILQNTLSDKMEIESIKMNKLPNDNFSVDNAIIINKSLRWSLLIDPQSQANDWLKETFISNDKEFIDTSNIERKAQQSTYYIIKPTMDNNKILNITHKCIEYGFNLLFQNVGETLNSILSPLYRKEIDSHNCISLSANHNPTLHKKFRFYITTQLSSPHYSPDVCVSLTLVNFTVTEDGLEDQMLNFCVEKEELEKEINRKRCIEVINNLNHVKRECENRILNELSSADKETILDNLDLIHILEKSSEQSKNIETQLANQVKMEEEIKKTRAFYRSVANHVAQLFFTISDLSNIEPVYQYSMSWYKEIFYKTITFTQETVSDKTKRIEPLKFNFTSFLYDKVSISLFEKDKIVFSFMIYLKINKISKCTEELIRYNKEIRYIINNKGFWLLLEQV